MGERLKNSKRSNHIQVAWHMAAWHFCLHVGVFECIVMVIFKIQYVRNNWSFLLQNQNNNKKPNQKLEKSCLFTSIFIIWTYVRVYLHVGTCTCVYKYDRTLVSKKIFFTFQIMKNFNRSMQSYHSNSTREY